MIGSICAARQAGTEERVILRELMQGYSYVEVGDLLGLSESGLKKKVGVIMKRVGVSSRPRLMPRRGPSAWI